MEKTMRTLAVTLLAAAFIALPSTPFAQEARPPSICQAIAETQPALPIIKAKLGVQNAQAIKPTEVSITYVSHSTFRIENAEGLTIATDYAGFAGLDVIPEVVTMNHAHGTHFTVVPDTRIEHVLRGWGTDGNPAKHYHQIGNALIRNVTTDINNQWAGYEPDGNSIFIFEMAGLCIGHLGHLHHLPSDGHYAQIGRIDILMVPVDGGHTMSVEDMSKVVRRLNASMVLPMHWFGAFSLNNFLNEIRSGFPVEVRNQSGLTASLNTLPAAPTVIVLQPESAFGLFDGD